jgi:hypothetical protein
MTRGRSEEKSNAIMVLRANELDDKNTSVKAILFGNY